MNHADFYAVRRLFDENGAPALRLLTRSRDTTALVISFFFRAFKVGGKPRYRQSELVTLLADFLFRLDTDDFPRPAREYLDEWAGEGFLRKLINPANSEDEYAYELTPDAERVLRWVQELDQTDFVGTESRLLQIFNLMREIALRSSEDADRRIAALREEIEEKEREIARIEAGEVDVWNETRVRENFRLLEENARRLLSDFRQVEYNFREIDRGLREQIARTPLSKGKLLDALFQTLDERIWQQDQGRSFRGFWEFLMSAQRQAEFDAYRDQILALPPLAGVAKTQSPVETLKLDLLDAGAQTNEANALIVRSIRRFIESSFAYQNRLVTQRIKAVLDVALRVKTRPPTGRNFQEITGKPDLNYRLMDLSPERTLFQVPRAVRVETADLEEGTGTDDVDLLYRQVYVSPAVLRERLRLLLRASPQVSLRTVAEEFPFEHGLTELLTYLKLASDDEPRQKAVFDPETAETLSYLHGGEAVEVRLPRVVFLR